MMPAAMVAMPTTVPAAMPATAESEPKSEERRRIGIIIGVHRRPIDRFVDVARLRGIDRTAATAEITAAGITLDRTIGDAAPRAGAAKHFDLRARRHDGHDA